MDRRRRAHRRRGARRRGGRRGNARRPTARVAPATLPERLIARAEVVPSDGVAEVRARAEGRVLRVLVREGDRVRAGQLLAEIEAESLQAEVQRRQAERSALDANAASVAAPARPDERALAEAEAAALRESTSSRATRPSAPSACTRGSGAGRGGRGRVAPPPRGAACSACAWPRRAPA